MDPLAPLFVDRATRLQAMPESAREEISKLNQLAIDSGDEDFIDRELTISWMSQRTGRDAKVFRDHFDVLSAQYFGEGTTAKSAYDQISKQYNEDPTFKLQSNFEAIGEDPTLGKAGILYNMGQWGRTLPAGAASTGYVAAGGFYSHVRQAFGPSKAMGFDIIEPEENAEWAKLNDEVNRASGSVEYTVWGGMGGIKKAAPKIGGIDVDANKARMAEIMREIDAKNIETMKLWADSPAGIISKQASEYSKLMYDMSEFSYEAYGSDEQFRNTFVGGLVASAGSVAVSAIFAAGGPAGFFMGNSMFFGQAEKERMQFEGADYDSFAAYQGNFTTGTFNHFLEWSFGVEKFIRRGWGVTPKTMGMVRKKDMAKNMVIRGAKTGAEEGVTEISQGAWTDYIASMTYDEGRELLTYEKAGERLLEGFAGFILGSIFGAGGSVVSDFQENRFGVAANAALAQVPMTNDGALFRALDFQVMRQIRTDEEIMAMAGDDAELGKILVRAANGDAEAVNEYAKRVIENNFVDIDGVTINGYIVSSDGGKPVIRLIDGTALELDMSVAEDAKLWQDIELESGKRQAARMITTSELAGELERRQGPLTLTINQVAAETLAEQVSAGTLSQEAADRALRVAIEMGDLDADVATLENTQFRGRARAILTPEGHYKAIAELASDADPTTVIEEVGEAMLKVELNERRVTQEQLTEYRNEWYRQTEQDAPEVEGKDVAVLNTEWFSTALIDYTLANRKQVITGGLARWLKSFGSQIKKMLGISQKVKKLQRDGKLNPELEALFKMALGVEGTGTQQARQKRADVTAAMMAESGVEQKTEEEMESEALERDGLPASAAVMGPALADDLYAEEQVGARAVARAAAESEADPVITQELSIQAQRIMEEEGLGDTFQLGAAAKMAASPKYEAEVAALRKAAKESDDGFFDTFWPKMLRLTGTNRKPTSANYKFMAEKSVAEIVEWLKYNPQYLDYYHKDWDATRALLDQVFPNFTDDHFVAFRLITGVTSPSTPLRGNLADAMQVMDLWMREGSMAALELEVSPKGNLKVKAGGPFKLQSNTGANKIRTLHVLEKLYKRLDSWQAVNDYLYEGVTKKEVNAFNKEMGYKGTAVTGNIERVVEEATGQKELVPRMFIFGQKVGAYTMNTTGDDRYTTTDIWEGRFIRSHFPRMFSDGTGLPENVNEHKIFQEFATKFNDVFAEQTGLDLPPSAMQAIRWFYMIHKAREAGYSNAQTNGTISEYAQQAAAQYLGINIQSDPEGGGSGIEGDTAQDVPTEAEITFQLSGIPQNSGQNIQQQASAKRARDLQAKKIPVEDYESKHRRIKSTSDGYVMSKMAVPISGRLQRINPVLAQRLRRFEFNTGLSIKSDTDQVEGFLEGMARITIPADRVTMDMALKNGEIGERDRIARQYGFLDDMKKVDAVLASLRNRMIKSGYNVGEIDGYFPRYVADSRGREDYYEGTKIGGQIEAAILKAEAEAKKNKKYLSTADRDAIVNYFLDSKPTKKLGPSSAKARTVRKVTGKANTFYMLSADALIKHIEEANESVERANFFGANVRFDKKNDGGLETGTDVMLDDSIGALINQIREAEGMTRSEEDQIKSMLTARFNDTVAGAQWVNNLKGVSYLTTMGQFSSAVTQIGDMTWSIYEAGGFNTARALVPALIRKSAITRDDMGIEQPAAEFRDMGTINRLVNKVFFATGLDYIDRVGKETLINAKILRMKQQIKDGKFDSKTQTMLEASFSPDEITQVIKDITDGKKTEDVVFLAYSTLADFQPINKSEYPEQYLRMPNGRIIYMLKSFTIKQFESFRREGIDQMINGKTAKEKAVGLAKVMHLAGLFMLMGLPTEWIKDFIKNRNTSMSDIMIDSAWKLFGLNSYQGIRFARSRSATEALYLAIGPPFPYIDRPIRDIYVAATKWPDITMKEFHSYRLIPVVGGFIHDWWGAGSNYRPKSSNSGKTSRRRTLAY